MPGGRLDRADGVSELVRRRELVWMGAIAAAVGLALAALLTASFGAKSSGPPAALRPATPTPSAVAKKTAAEATVRRRHPARKHRKHHSHPRDRRHAAPAKPTHTTPTLAQAERPASQTQPVAGSQPTQTVASPAPAPEPVRQLSRPKRSTPGGASFDDSG
jgi:hypothetical protein